MSFCNSFQEDKEDIQYYIVHCDRLGIIFSKSFAVMYLFFFGFVENKELLSLL